MRTRCIYLWAGLALAGVLAASASADMYLARTINMNSWFGPLGNNPIKVVTDGTYAYIAGDNESGSARDIGILKINLSDPNDAVALSGGTQMVNSFRYYGGLVVRNSILYALCDRPDGNVSATNVRAIDVATGLLVPTFAGDGGTGNGIVTQPAGMTLPALGGLAYDPGAGGYAGLSMLAYGSGKRVLIDASDGTTLYTTGSGMVVTDTAPVGGCTVADASAWRAHAYDPNGNIYMRRSNQVQWDTRGVGNAITEYHHVTDALDANGAAKLDCGDGKPVALRVAASIIGQNIVYLPATSAGTGYRELLIFNDHYSNSSPNFAFADVVKVITPTGDLPSPAFQLLKGDGTALTTAEVPNTYGIYDFAYDDVSDRLLILDWMHRNLYVFTSTMPPPTPPSLVSPLVQGDTTVTVKGIFSGATDVTVYAGVTAIGSVTNPPADPNGVPVPVTSLVARDLITAKQTTPAGTSDASAALEVGSGNGDLLVCIGIRDTGDTGALGTSGDPNLPGSIVWIGASGLLSGAPQGLVLAVSPSWQTFTFDPVAGPLLAFPDGGTGTILNTRGQLEHVAVAVKSDAANRSSGPYALYVDDVVNVGADTGGADFLITNFDSYTPPAQVLFRDPAYSGSTSTNMVYPPDASESSAEQSFSAPNSEKLTWFFKDSTAGRWARITTAAAANLPRPIIDLTKPIQLKLLLPSPIQTGACCVTSTCTIMTAADCATAGGIYRGDNTTCEPNPCYCRGDTNCDQQISYADINPFVRAITSESLWKTTFAGSIPPEGCTYLGACDVNGSSAVDYGDINPFVTRLQSPGVCP